MLCSTLLIAAFALSGSLALPQQQAGSTISIPGVQLSPASQTACVQSCSQKTANENPVDIKICTERRGQTPTSCLCTDAKLNSVMQACYMSQCPPLASHCASILGGSSFIGGVESVGPGAQDTPAPGAGPGTPAAGTSADGAGKPPVAPFPDINLPAAQQVSCVRQCTDNVARANGPTLNTCEQRLGQGHIPRCICTDDVLGAAMRRCLSASCPPLAAQGRCAAIIPDGQSFVSSGSGAAVNSSSSSSNTSGGSGSSGSSAGSGGAVAPGSVNGLPGNPGGSGSAANGAGYSRRSKERALMGVLALSLLIV